MGGNLKKKKEEESIGGNSSSELKFWQCVNKMPMKHENKIMMIYTVLLKG